MSKPNCTAVIPVHRSQQDSPLLQDAIRSLGEGTPYVVAVNDGNVAEALNEAVKMVDTRWVIPFQFDDVAGPYLIEAMLHYGFSADVVYPNELHATLENEVFHEEPARPFCPHRLWYDAYIPWGSMFLRESLLKVPFRDELAPIEHWDACLRGSRAGWRFKPCPEVHVVKRHRNGCRSEVPKERAEELMAMIREGKPDFPATFYYQATPACAYLRCILPARHLPAVARNDLVAFTVPREGLEGHPQTADDIERGEFPTHEGEAAVLQFAGDVTWALFLHHLQDQGNRVLVEVDDNYLIDPGKAIRGQSNWGRNIGDAVHTFQGHRTIVKWADGVIVTTEELARAYRKFNDNVFVIPNPVDDADWPYQRSDNDKLRIGWFASVSHAGDEKLIRRGVEWAVNQPDVELVTLGYNPWGPDKSTATTMKNHTHIPWVNDLDMYRALMTTLDIGLCPVIEGTFSRFRSDIKASEYTMGGAAVIASDVPPYADWTDDFSIKAKTAKDFYHGLKRLVQNRDETKQMAAEARKWVDRNRNIRVLVERWREALAKD